MTKKPKGYEDCKECLYFDEENQAYECDACNHRVIALEDNWTPRKEAGGD